ncbi:hypothetical protein HRR81_005749 [Exophiala dermatitidis]|nr:hypothetical protein HRR81_005749 [Exophiala dermatitidis]KAJ4632380.1 hypothetical protein HRR88_001928 [Exophiala dermatitidis]KAJ4664007.1 hypothetical protein HRR95_009134 [Exophiala dermatitidis]
MGSHGSSSPACLCYQCTDIQPNNGYCYFKLPKPHSIIQNTRSAVCIKKVSAVAASYMAQSLWRLVTSGRIWKLRIWTLGSTINLKHIKLG